MGKHVQVPDAKYTNVFKESNFKIFSNQISKGSVVKGIIVKNTANQPRSFFDKLNNWARDEGAAGLGYIIFEENFSKSTRALSPSIFNILPFPYFLWNTFSPTFNSSSE